MVLKLYVVVVYVLDAYVSHVVPSHCCSNNRLDGSDKNKRIMERIKWRKSSVVNRRMELAYGLDSRAVKMPSTTNKNIWRGNAGSSAYANPPPSKNSNNQGSGRGTKRKGQKISAADKPRAKTRRTTRKTRNNNA